MIRKKSVSDLTILYLEKIATEYMKDRMNCGERYEDMIDHRSYAHNLSSCEIKA